jgi:hypothetical protein
VLVREALAVLVAEGREIGAPVERHVAALKAASASSNGVSPEEHASRYAEALVQLLALYFEEEAD